MNPKKGDRVRIHGIETTIDSVSIARPNKRKVFWYRDGKGELFFALKNEIEELE